jgi:nucleoid-associated protein YgaU
VQKLIEPQCREYTVQKGDTSFERVAARKEVYGDERRSDAVARANPWADPTKLKPGITVLRIPVDPTNIQGKLVWVEEPIAEEAPSPPVPTPAPEPPPQPPAKTYTTQRNDTLSDISKKFYGRAGLWKLIADANKDVISNPDRLPNGVVIKIPPAPAGHPGSPPD